MGYNITISSDDLDAVPAEAITSVKVGSYGSQDVLLSLLFAGYAAGNWPESQRVRRWFTPPPFGAGIPVPVTDRSRRSVQELIAFNHDDSTWAWTDDETVQRAVQMKAPSCPVLSALVAWWQVRNDLGGALPVHLVKRLAPVLVDMGVLLNTSCWRQTVVEVGELFSTAAAIGAPVEFG